MADRVVVCVGTRRGLFVYESSAKRREWKRRGPFLEGWAVYHAVVDARRSPRIHAAAVSDVFATTVMSADLKSAKFTGAKAPPVPPKPLQAHEKFYKQWGISRSPRVWHIEPGRTGEKGVLYAGTAPAGLFRSEDDGQTWEPNDALNNHPTRRKWMPGAGGMSAHSIQLDPANGNRMYVAISACGAWRTDDGGKSWTAINKAVAKYPGAPKDGEVGSCVHKLLLHPAVPGRLYQQNHVGAYRSDDYGATWNAIHMGLPSDFGFGLALDANNPDTCFTTPLKTGTNYQFRATEGPFRVYRWNGPGKGWTGLSKGLPAEGAYLSVLREGMSADTLNPCGVYVGTGTGTVFHSADAGRSWSRLAEFLPPVLSVTAAVV
ncbi:MAG: hypothetical protein IT452_17090 [Planctomycetia bacterium]|nr:hypothetical protein [Planctomycetia bacterium]